MTRFSIAACLGMALCGCDIHSHVDATRGTPMPSPVRDGAWSLATPPKIAAFDRVEAIGASPQTAGITVAYSRMVGDEAVVATIHVRPVLGSDALISSLDLGSAGITSAASSQSMAASIAQVRRFYPQAEIVTERTALLLEKGALQPGRFATLAYSELHAGQQRPMRLAIYTFCCADGQWAYEYRFRHPAYIEDDAAIAEFMRSTSWDPPHAS